MTKAVTEKDIERVRNYFERRREVGEIVEEDEELMKKLE
jgi:RIO-like serine/threonine protein kinase